MSGTKVASPHADAAGKKRQRGRRSAASGGPAKAGQQPRDPAATPHRDIADETLLVESPQQFATRMRQLLATLFREQATTTGHRFPLAAPKLGATQQFTSEQIWGQMSVLYAPVLSKVADNVSRLRQAEQRALEERKAAKKAAAAAKSSKKVTIQEDDEADDSDESFSDDVASAGGLSSDEEVDRLKSRLRRNRGGKNKKGGAAGVDDWRYALGKPSELEDDIMTDDEDDIGEDDMAPRGKRRDDAPAAGGDSDDEDALDAAAMAADDSELGDEADEEPEDGDASEADSAAAMRELYGSDAGDGGDDDDENDDDEDPFEDENFGEFLDEHQLDEEEEEADDDGAGGGGGAAASSPFGPTAAPENPLDFTDIDNDKTLTTFEKNELKRLRTVKDMELNRVHRADWAMTGEVAGKARPRDSLIDTTLDFEHALPPAPIVTEYFTAKLEDRIKRRIADGNFDDVARKVMRTTAEDLQTSKRDEALDAQKSKLSLMDLYEKEFLDKQAAVDRAEGGPATAEALTEVERDELKAVQMWKRLSQHLDALSNFYFTPKPINPEVEARVRAVQNQAPAITLESVGMSALAKEDVLAPQDVFRPKRGVHTDAAASELEPEERKAIRRAAKASTKAAEGRKEKQHAGFAKAKAARKEKQDGGAGKKKD